MPVLNFQERFAPLVKSRRKRQTIRAFGKRRYRPGDRLYLYTGLRTKRCSKLGEAICKSVTPVVISPNGVFVDGGLLMGRRFVDFAIADGFESTADFREFFQRHYNYHREPFYGRLIQW